MVEDVEILESLSQPSCCMLSTSTPTKPQDITSTTDLCRCGSQPTLDVSEELECLEIIQQEVVQETSNYVARMMLLEYLWILVSW